MLALQRFAGNRAVGRLLGPSAPHRAGAAAAAIQRDDGTATTEADQRTPEQRVDDATFAGYSTWAQSATADADSTLTDAQAVAEALPSPHQERMFMLVGDLTGQANTLDWGVQALRSGRDAPVLTADPTGFAAQFEHRIQVLREVTEAWQAVTASSLMTLIGMVAEAQVERARALRRELQDLERELRELQRILQGKDLAGAFAQLGINAVITAALFAITFTNPVVIVAVSVGSLAVQAGLDELLGPSGNDARDVAAAGTSIAGSAAEARVASRRLAESSSKLKAAGKRLGAIGAAAGTVLDVLETQEAIAAYEQAQTRIRAATSRLERVSRELAPLLPLLQYPDLAARMVATLQSQAQILRENGQITLQGHGQL